MSENMQNRTQIAVNRTRLQNLRTFSCFLDAKQVELDEKDVNRTQNMLEF